MVASDKNKHLTHRAQIIQGTLLYNNPKSPGVGLAQELLGTRGLGEEAQKEKRRVADQGKRHLGSFQTRLVTDTTRLHRVCKAHKLGVWRQTHRTRAPAIAPQLSDLSLSLPGIRKHLDPALLQTCAAPSAQTSSCPILLFSCNSVPHL